MDATEPSKPCRDCGITKPLTNFYKHPEMRDGHLHSCKECRKGYGRRHYQDIGGTAEADRNRQQRSERRAQKVASMQKHRAKNPLKYKARNAVSNALRDGRLIRKPCEVCGNPHVQAHHSDYSKPLDVRWLCFEHHREDEHGQELRSDPARATCGTADNATCTSVAAG